MTRADVRLWGRRIGAVRWDGERKLGIFEYDRDFALSKIEVAPLTLPLRQGVFDFPNLRGDTFYGLPGLLADSLPDKFGNALIDRWLAEQGRPPGSMNPVERLLYTGSRGMGALEFHPLRAEELAQPSDVAIDALVQVANHVLQERSSLRGELQGGRHDQAELEALLRVGTSAGGARAKAVLAYNETTGQFRSGQVKADGGFEHWLMKFDGVSKSGDHGLADPQGYTRLEYACYLLAIDVGVEMSECRLYEEGGRAHFMTRRFDRESNGQKTHMLSLGAMRHFDFNSPQAYSYEQAVETLRLLGLGYEAQEQMLLRAITNIVIRNQDDHVKNIAFLMDKAGRWSLSPAYDLVYAYNPDGLWTREHQMTLNSKADKFVRSDIHALAERADVKRRRADRMLDRVIEAARDWDNYAHAANVPEALAAGAQRGFRLFEAA